MFQDADSVRPGRQWRRQINEALEAASLVVLFWCLHSRDSEEVSNEYTSAIRANRDIVPLLLDDTPLPQPLHEYQWVDFRHLAGPAHRAVVAAESSEGSPVASTTRDIMVRRPAKPVPAAKKMSRPAAVGAVLLLIFGALSGYLALSQSRSSPSVAGLDSLPPPVDTLPPPNPSQTSVTFVATLALSGLVVIALAILGARRRQPAPAEPAARIAEELLGLVTARLKGPGQENRTLDGPE